MNRRTIPPGFENALLQRAEQYQDLGAYREAAEYRRLARGAGRAGSARTGSLYFGKKRRI